MNKYLTLLFAPAATLIMAACSNIAEEDRIIYVAPHSERNILIEDFTGQKCINCPKATELIHELQETYGEDVIIPVAIHCGGYGIAAPKGLMTDLGKTYGDEIVSLLGQPSGRINRHTNDSHTAWTSIVTEVAKYKATAEIELSCNYDEKSRSLNLKSILVDTNNAACQYQLWLTEDSIVALQYMPKNTTERQYIHNHVLRDAINGVDGDLLSFEKDTIRLSHNYTIPDNYVAEHCAVVAFLHDNQQGVREVIKVKIKK